ncbi:MAG: hypothetical protein JJU40_00900 [Rhodobacteraceae bacterium]|nr:hypothetical protein [Paracoccaceae bacterium]
MPQTLRIAPALRQFGRDDCGAVTTDYVVIVAASFSLAAAIGVTVLPRVVDVAERSSTEISEMMPKGGAVASAGMAAGGDGGIAPGDDEEDVALVAPEEAEPPLQEAQAAGTFWTWVIGWLFG